MGDELAPGGAGGQRCGLRCGMDAAAERADERGRGEDGTGIQRKLQGGNEEAGAVDRAMKG